MDLYLGGRCGVGGAYIQRDLYLGLIHFSLQSVKLTFLSFLPVKHVFWYFSRCGKCQICSKLTIKTPEYVKLAIKLKIKTPLTSFWPLYC